MTLSFCNISLYSIIKSNIFNNIICQHTTYISTEQHPKMVTLPIVFANIIQNIQNIRTYFAMITNAVFKKQWLTSEYALTYHAVDILLKCTHDSQGKSTLNNNEYEDLHTPVKPSSSTNVPVHRDFVF